MNLILNGLTKTTPVFLHISAQRASEMFWSVSPELQFETVMVDKAESAAAKVSNGRSLKKSFQMLQGQKYEYFKLADNERVVCMFCKVSLAFYI